MDDELAPDDGPHADQERTGEPERTGDEVVDAALAELAQLTRSDVGLEEHVRVLDDVHQALQQRLSATQV